ncbi:MAG: hypothetical protein FJ267_12905, partial [Planctomycetes bacterium]|nr:hypothetical protein [Planctomycetota bacterium]
MTIGSRPGSYGEDHNGNSSYTVSATSTRFDIDLSSSRQALSHQVVTCPTQSPSCLGCGLATFDSMVGPFAQSLVVTLLIGTFAFGQSGSSSTPTLSELQTRLRHSQSEVELDPATKQKVIDTYRAAVERMEIAEEETAKSKSFQLRLKGVHEQLNQAKLQQATLAASVKRTIPDVLAETGDDVEKIERLLEERERVLDEPENGLRSQLATAEKELGSRIS